MTFNSRINEVIRGPTTTIVNLGIAAAFDFEFPGIIRSEILDCVNEIKT